MVDGDADLIPVLIPGYGLVSSCGNNKFSSIMADYPLYSMVTSVLCFVFVFDV